MRGKRLIALLLLAGAAMPAKADGPVAGPATGQTQEAPKPKPDYHCPPTTYVNCMPPISDDRRGVCSKDYIAWMQAHCPNSQVVY